MAAKLTTIKNEIASGIASLFPSKTLITNPYFLEANHDNILRNGFGVRIGPGEPAEFDMNNYEIESRNFIVSLSYEIVRLDGSRDEIETMESLFTEEKKTLKNFMLNASQLGQAAIVGKIDYLGDSGIEFSMREKYNFAYIDYTFSIDVIEKIDE